MALSNAVSYDVIVKLQDRGPVNGTPMALALVDVTTLARRFQTATRIGKRLDVSGFGTSNRYRPGKGMDEITLELLIEYAGRMTLKAGNYCQVTKLIGENDEIGYIGYLESLEDDINDDAEAIQRLVICGPADGGEITTMRGSLADESESGKKVKAGANA